METGGSDGQLPSRRGACRRSGPAGAVCPEHAGGGGPLRHVRHDPRLDAARASRARERRPWRADWTDFAARALGRLGRGSGSARRSRSSRARSGAARLRRRPRCSTSPTTRRASSTARSTRPSPRNGRPTATPRARDRDLARRLGQPGAGGDRRARGAGGDAGARLRHRRHRRASRARSRPTGSRSCRTIPRPTPRRSCSWCARATPKGIEDWGDLVADGVQVITPNPKTSGGARWNYLAAWAWAERERPGPAKAFVGQLFANVPVLDTGARGSTTTFAQRGIGDVLLAWENEAYPRAQGARRGPVRHRRALGLDARRAAGGARRGQPRLATSSATPPTAYLDYLYSPEGQALAFKHFYRAWDAEHGRPRGRRPLPRARAGHDRRLRRLGQGAARALRRRRRLRPDLRRPVSASPDADARARLPPPLAAAGLRPRLRHGDDDALDRRPGADRRAAACGARRSGRPSSGRSINRPRVWAALRAVVRHLALGGAVQPRLRAGARLGAGALPLPGAAADRRRGRPALRAADGGRGHRADRALRAERRLRRSCSAPLGDPGRLHAARHLGRAGLRRPALRGAHGPAGDRGDRARGRGGLGHARRPSRRAPSAG